MIKAQHVFAEITLQQRLRVRRKSQRSGQKANQHNKVLFHSEVAQAKSGPMPKATESLLNYIYV